jgi:hypothetical protein
MNLISQIQSTHGKYTYYKWNKDGEKMEKSIKKPEKNINDTKDSNTKDNNVINTPKLANLVNNNEGEESDRYKVTDIDNFFDYRSFRKDLDRDNEDNDKCICNERLTGRDKIIQRSVNPFLSNNNYLTDLSIQDKFLRPKNSSYGKI